MGKSSSKLDMEHGKCRQSNQFNNKLPVTVPDTTVPFFSSMVTDSLLSFIKNLGNGSKAGSVKMFDS